jgi:tetratricopeptide (TPR) repeat protein
MKMYRRFFSPLVAFLFAGALLSQPGIAVAAGKSGKDTVSKVVEINKQALAQLQAGKYDAARDALWNAIAILTDANLSDHAIAARTHVHLAAVYMTGFNDRTKAIRQFVMALKIDPNIKITPQVETAALDEALDAAHGQAGGARTVAAPDSQAGKAPEAAPAAEDRATSVGSGLSTGTSGRRRGARPFVDREEPSPPSRVPEPFYCPLPSEVPPKTDIMVRCVTQKKPRGASATIFYRESGSEEFTPLPMIRSPKGWLAATVPAAAVTGSAFSYYLEAKVPGVKESLTIGTADGPNLMPIIEGAAPVNNTLLAMLLQGKDTSMRTAPVGEDNAPLEEINKQYQIDEDLRKYHRRLPGSVFISVGGGAFGTTYQGKTRPDSHEMKPNNTSVEINPGYLPASLFQLVFELGYQFTDRFALSLQGRYQYTPPDSSGWNTSLTKASSPPTSALAVFLRGQYSFFTAGNFQAFASGTAGGGQRAFLGYVQKKCDNPNDSIKCPTTGTGHSDTVSSGPVAFGVGVGMMYHLSRSFAIWVEGRGMSSVAPFAVLAEFNGGLAFAYKIERSAPPPTREEGGWERPPGEEDKEEKPEAPPASE